MPKFGDKEALFTEAVGAYAADALRQTRALLSAEPLGLGNIRRYFAGMAYGSNCRGCLMTMTANERELVPDAALDRVRSALAEIEGLFEANLAHAGVEAGERRRLATFLVFTVQGITTMGKLNGDEAALARVVETVGAVLDPLG